MKTANWVGTAVALALLAGNAAAQTVSLASPVATARWGAPLALQATLGDTCAPSSHYTGSLTVDMPYLSPGGNIAGSASFSPAAACTSLSLALPLDWTRIPADWQSFRANANLTAGGPARSNIVPVRLDHEFQIPYSGNLVQATLSTYTTPPYSLCNGRSVRVFDRETVGIPMPPPNLRTPYEMFAFQSGGCGVASAGNHQQLLALDLPSRIGTVFVYDNASGSPRWRKPADFCLAPGAVCPYNHPPAATYFERSAIIPLVGNGGGVFAVVAVVYPQPDLRTSDLQDLWWAGPSESGWGLNIAQSDQKLFVSTFIYDRSGKAVWAVMPNGAWDESQHVFYGDLYIPHGAPYNAYGPNLFDMRAPVGTGSLSFLNDSEGHFDYTIDGYSGGKSISRYVFAKKGDTPPPYGGIWWGGPGQDGWGLSVVQQGETVFATWYTYGTDGEPAWFFMPAGQRTAAGKYAGKLYRTTGATWPGAHYSGDSTKVIEVGTMELAFADKDKGTISTVVDGKSIVNPLQRFQFF